jgi:uncharacterized protein YggE
MIRSTLILLGGMACALRAQTSTSASASAPEIINTGRGEVRLRPDRVSLIIGLVTQSSSAAEASSLNASRIRPMLAALRRLGVPDSALVTTGYNVHRTYAEDNQPVPAANAYTARNSVEITLKRVEDLGWMIDSALSSGATEVSGITFASSQAATARQRAIAIGIEKARGDAAAAAAPAGRKLGGIIEIVIDPNDSRGFPMNRLSEVVVSGPGETPMLPADIRIVVDVRVRSALVRSP